MKKILYGIIQFLYLINNYLIINYIFICLLVLNKYIINLLFHSLNTIYNFIKFGYNK